MFSTGSRHLFDASKPGGSLSRSALSASAPSSAAPAFELTTRTVTLPPADGPRRTLRLSVQLTVILPVEFQYLQQVDSDEELSFDRQQFTLFLFKERQGGYSH